MFGLVVGLVFVIWGVWEVLDIDLDRGRTSGRLLPILFIVGGAALVISAVLRRPRS
jgi:hypothetical protein